jgi:1,4-dihydroxy-2-naphthoate octaprenyltransferase
MASGGVVASGTLDRISLWVRGARPRTLPAALAPVLVGSALVAGKGVHFILWRSLAAAVVALFIQIGTNYANDYSDGIRGTDDDRVGPVRLVAGRLATPSQVKYAAMACFAVACLAGLALAVAVSWWLILVGAACVGAGWLYTGGPRPYGYVGLGEVFVFVFFGLMATAGTAFVLDPRFSVEAIVAGAAMGFGASALLAVNNLRDLKSDSMSNKRTLAVKLGDRWARLSYVGMLLLAVASAASLASFGDLFALLSLVSLLPAFYAARAVLKGALGSALVPVLGRTSLTLLTLAIGLSVGLLLR